MVGLSGVGAGLFLSLGCWLFLSLGWGCFCGWVCCGLAELPHSYELSPPFSFFGVRLLGLWFFDSEINCRKGVFVARSLKQPVKCSFVS